MRQPLPPDSIIGIPLSIFDVGRNDAARGQAPRGPIGEQGRRFLRRRGRQDVDLRLRHSHFGIGLCGRFGKQPAPVRVSVFLPL